ncbi:MAG: FdrA family protein [Nocardioides sp.]
MTTHVELRAAYADSVTLLQVSRTLQDEPGVAAAQVAMATALNCDVLDQMGFVVPAGATPNDMVVAIRLTDDAAPEALDRALAALAAALAPPPPPQGALTTQPARTTRAALAGSRRDAGPRLGARRERAGGGDGRARGRPRRDGLQRQRALEQTSWRSSARPPSGAARDGARLRHRGGRRRRPRLRQRLRSRPGRHRGRLRNRLPAADDPSAPGGVGVTHALGVGGRDLSVEVAGASTREALRRLDADPGVELVVLVSKPPAPEVAADLETYAAGLATPVEMALLGPGRPDLTTAADGVLRRLGGRCPTGRWWAGPARPPGRGCGGSSSAGRRRSHGDRHRGAGPDSLQHPARGRRRARLGGSLTAARHTMVDFGDDALTAGRAHPMIDPTLRTEHLARAAADPETGVVLLDLVLGHGAEPDPATTLASAIARAREARAVPVIVSVIGTDLDPQHLARQLEALNDAGAELHFSNARATRRALELLGGVR